MKFPIRRKFFLFVLVLAIIPLLLVSTFSFLGSRRALLETIATENTSFTLSAARGIRDQVFSYRSILESTAESMVMAETIAEKKDILIGLKKGFVAIESLAVLDKEGKEIVRSDDKPLQDRKDCPEFYITKKEEFYFAWLKYNEEQALSSVILSVSLLKEGEFEGVLVADIFLYDIWNQAMIASLSPSDNCYVFTQEGQLVAKITAPKEEFRSDDLERIALNAALERKLFTKEEPTEIGSMLIIASPVPVLNWELVIFRPTAEIYKPASIIRNQAIIISILSLIFISILTVFFTRLFVEPIRKLHEGVEIIGKGNLDYKVDIKTGDEIEQLAKEFNKMVEGLKESQEALKEERASLEIKVKARTKELEELAKSLDQKVKERTKELQERVNELEKFHKLTIGRELRMTELKKEIKKLKEELEKYKKKQV